MAADTIVFQSYRTVDVAPWLERCMESVRLWTRAQGYDYRFLDDAFLRRVPAWYAEKSDGHIYLVSDLARLLVARELLAEGYRRVIWMDADVLVFAPARFKLEIGQDHAFCPEVWIMRDAAGVIRAHGRVNNAISVFDRGNPFLEFYLHACQRIVRSRPRPVPPLSVGTKLLTALHAQLRFDLVPHAGLLSPLLQGELLLGAGPAARLLMERHAGPLFAANLCAHFQGKESGGVCLSADDFDAVVDLLLDSGGDALNRLGRGDSEGRSFQVSPSYEPDSPRSRYLWGE